MAEDHKKPSPASQYAGATSASPPVMRFPVSFPIKVMGKDTPEFHQAVAAIFSRHAAPYESLPVKRNSSSGGQFISLTVTIVAQSREQLDALYLELTSCEHVLVTL